MVAVVFVARVFKAEPPPKKSRLPPALPVMEPPVILKVALPSVWFAVEFTFSVPPTRLITVKADAPPP